MKLRKKYGHGSKKIAKLLGVSHHKMEGWIYQKFVPRPIKALKVLDKLGLSLPLCISKNNKFFLFLKIFAFTFGDGGIGKDFRVYLTRDEKDMEDLKKEIDVTFGLQCKIDKVNSKNSRIKDRLIRGRCFELDIQGKGSYILGRLLHSVGAPLGEKVITTFLIPQWIMKGPKWIKKLFLEILLVNEIQTPKLRKNKNRFGGIFFGMVKAKEYFQNHQEFLSQIKTLLKEFEIETSEIKSLSPKEERKDGRISCPAGFYISANKFNIYKFYKQFNLPYVRKKQEIFDNSFSQFLKNIHKSKV